MLADGDRPGARAAAAVRAGEGLVRVVMHQVHPHVAGPDDAQDRVHVGAVEVEQGPPVVEQPGDLADLRVEEADRVRVGDHEHGRLVAQLGLEILESTMPQLLLLIVTASKPARWAEAGLVPWALSGTSTCVRVSSFARK